MLGLAVIKNAELRFLEPYLCPKLCCKEMALSLIYDIVLLKTKNKKQKNHLSTEKKANPYDQARE
jgi:hypothetical protein